MSGMPLLSYAIWVPIFAGLLVLATCGGGPLGTTQVLARASGNSMATASALSDWFDGIKEETP